MQGTERSDVDPFDAHCRWASEVLDAAATAHGNAGDHVSAFACAWGADLTRLQAALRGSMSHEGTLPRRDYFATLHTCSEALNGMPTNPHSLLETLDVARERLRQSLMGDLGHVPDITFSRPEAWKRVPMPTDDELAASRRQRLSNKTEQDYLVSQRSRATALMVRAQSALLAGEPNEAIRLAYESDMTALDAYLVASAAAAGDHNLITVTARWQLVAHRMGSIASLPLDFDDATRTVRTAMSAALGEPDGSRMLSSLVAL